MDKIKSFTVYQITMIQILKLTRKTNSGTTSQVFKDQLRDFDHQYPRANPPALRSHSVVVTSEIF